MFKLSSSYIPKFDAVIINMKKRKNSNISPSQECKVPTSVWIIFLMSGKQDRLPLRHMTNNMVMEVTWNKTITQFQVGFFITLKQQREFREQVKNAWARYSPEKHWSPFKNCLISITLMSFKYLCFMNIKTRVLQGSGLHNLLHNWKICLSILSVFTPRKLSVKIN